MTQPPIDRPPGPGGSAAAFPRARRALLWISAFLLVWTFLGHTVSTMGTVRPMFDTRWFGILCWTGGGFGAVLALVSMRQAQAWPRAFVTSLVAFAFAGSLPFLLGWIYHVRPVEEASAGRLLEEEPRAEHDQDWSGLGVLDWDDDVVAWCVALQSQPDDAARASHVAAMSQVLETAFQAQAFVPHGTLTAVTDIGALTPGAATALLANPRGLDEGESRPFPISAAREWLDDLARANPGDGCHYAMAHAVLVLFPDLPGLRETLRTALETNLPLPGTADAVSSLRNALVLAELFELKETAAKLRERIDPTLRGAWVDTVNYTGRETGWARSPEKAFGLADAYETHLALELLASSTVPKGLDLGHLRLSLENRGRDGRWNDRNERILANIDGATMDVHWPSASRRRFGTTDAVLVGLAILILGSAVDILRKPLTADAVSA